MMKTTFRFLLQGLFLTAFFSISLLGWSRDSKPFAALQDYINNGDASYSWQVMDSIQDPSGRAYRLRLVSQTWHEIPWVHEMEIFVPQDLRHAEALLFISGGSVKPETLEPNYHNWDNYELQALARVARNCHAVTAAIWQVPRQPLFGNLYEDEIIAYTLQHYIQDHDTSWPLLFPMAKSALRAIDAVQDFSKSRRFPFLPQKFVVSGVSKRGWTSWMTAATGDKRVVAIAPMVIDLLNLPVTLSYQQHMYGKFSDQLKDYSNLDFLGAFKSRKGKNLVTMIDPYSYRKKLKLPKLLLFGSNDEYWTADAVKNYLPRLRGKTLICYTPNAGHGLGDKKIAISALEAFFWQTIQGGSYPELNYKVTERSAQNVTLQLNVGTQPIEDVIVWEALSANSDFRKSEFIPRHISVVGSKFNVTVSLPSEGYKAFFVMVNYRHPVEAEPYRLSTRMYTADAQRLYDAPYRP